ncbi:MAG: Gfo/Idh/MocA family oxidoreductase [Fimbriiglobus sp.]|jgi:predicted dehydrogenase|nr:Gfo/Idh/MocA family oxidoreductase [Fimbriiglobus sp.]
MTRLKVAVVGVGHLGQHHARILSTFPDVDLVGVVDAHPEQAAKVAKLCRTRPFASHEPLVSLVDAVSIATPTVAHHPVAAQFLRAGVPVLVEKPICQTVAQADELVAIAAASGVPFQVGHIERFNPAFEELVKRPITAKFIEAERHGPYTGRSVDIGAVLDLMIHDIDLLIALVRSPVREVQAVGAAVFGGHEDMVNARLIFESGCVAHVTASRIAARPKRRMRIWAPEGYAGIDFVTRRLHMVQQSDNLRQNGLHPERMDAPARARLKDDVWGKHLEIVGIDGDRKWDQLTSELRHFVDCVKSGSTPRVTGEDGREALSIAERVLASVRSHQWNGTPDGCVGPTGMPPPAGKLFESAKNVSGAA